MFLSRQKLNLFVVEIIVVVVGILIAFQIDGWRENRQVQQDLESAMIRVARETDANIWWCTRAERWQTDDANAVQHVLMSLIAGQILDDNVEKFDRGFACCRESKHTTLVCLGR